MLKKCLPLLALAWLPVAIHAEALSAKAPAQEPTRIRFQIEAQENASNPSARGKTQATRHRCT
jgi:predicted component of type VI protein secretion system